jgi:hypothetical protein
MLCCAMPEYAIGAEGSFARNGWHLLTPDQTVQHLILYGRKQRDRTARCTLQAVDASRCVQECETEIQVGRMKTHRC